MTGAPRSGQLLASEARTATVASDRQSSPGGARGLRVVIDVTATAATPSITATIRGYDPVSGQTFDLLASSALTTTGTTVLTVYPGSAAAANSVADAAIGTEWDVNVAHADADSITYSIGYDYLA